MSDFIENVDQSVEGIDIPTSVEEVTPVEVEVVDTTPAVKPWSFNFKQTMAQSAGTIICGYIIGAGVQALGSAARKGITAGLKKGKALIEARKERRELKRVEKRAQKELAEESEEE